MYVENIPILQNLKVELSAVTGSIIPIICISIASPLNIPNNIKYLNLVLFNKALR